MKTYDVRCPTCGTINRNLYLDETDGFMECERCNTLSHSIEYHQKVSLPRRMKRRLMFVPAYGC